MSPPVKETENSHVRTIYNLVAILTWGLTLCLASVALFSGRNVYNTDTAILTYDTSGLVRGTHSFAQYAQNAFNNDTLWWKLDIIMSIGDSPGDAAYYLSTCERDLFNPIHSCTAHPVTEQFSMGQTILDNNNKAQSFYGDSSKNVNSNGIGFTVGVDTDFALSDVDSLTSQDYDAAMEKLRIIAADMSEGIALWASESRINTPIAGITLILGIATVWMLLIAQLALCCHPHRFYHVYRVVAAGALLAAFFLTVSSGSITALINKNVGSQQIADLAGLSITVSTTTSFLAITWAATVLSWLGCIVPIYMAIDPQRASGPSAVGGPNPNLRLLPIERVTEIGAGFPREGFAAYHVHGIETESTHSMHKYQEPAPHVKGREMRSSGVSSVSGSNEGHGYGSREGGSRRVSLDRHYNYTAV